MVSAPRSSTCDAASTHTGDPVGFQLGVADCHYDDGSADSRREAESPCKGRGLLIDQSVVEIWGGWDPDEEPDHSVCTQRTPHDADASDVGSVAVANLRACGGDMLITQVKQQCAVGEATDPSDRPQQEGVTACAATQSNGMRKPFQGQHT